MSIKDKLKKIYAHNLTILSLHGLSPFLFGKKEPEVSRPLPDAGEFHLTINPKGEYRNPEAEMSIEDLFANEEESETPTYDLSFLDKGKDPEIVEIPLEMDSEGNIRIRRDPMVTQYPESTEGRHVMFNPETFPGFSEGIYGALSHDVMENWAETPMPGTTPSFFAQRYTEEECSERELPVYIINNATGNLEIITQEQAAREEEELRQSEDYAEALERIKNPKPDDSLEGYVRMHIHMHDERNSPEAKRQRARDKLRDQIERMQTMLNMMSSFGTFIPGGERGKEYYTLQRKKDACELALKDAEKDSLDKYRG